MNILKPESYLSPFLLSYLSKYIQDIEQKNLQLSLWGGDAVLNNLKFKLDVLDDELGNIPFSFVSCQAQELRIHVPWNKLTSESIVVTLNTVECVLKLNCEKNLKKKREQQADSKPTENTSQQQQQSSYVDMLIKKIKRNVVFVVNNLILKYVEDDIVLSMNVHSFSYNPVDKNWKSAYLDLTESEPALRYLCKVQDLTVCLDRRGKSGNVETFEEPMLFRCHVDIRQHYTFASHLSKKPLINKIDIMFDHYHLNISEKQLPTMLHLLKLCMHLYYKQIEVNHSYVFDDSKVESRVEDSQGWASWAWSYVPPIMSYEESAEAERTPLTVVFGMYIKNLMINFKLSRTNKTKQFYWNESFRSKCLCQVQMEGVTLKLLAKGLEIFSCDFSVSLAKILCGNSFVGAKFLDMANDSLVIAEAGCSMFKFAENTLFDSRAPENNDQRFVYALNKETFFTFDENDNSKAFCSKYFYKAVDGRDEEDVEDEKFNDYLGKVCLTDFREWHQTQERSWKHLKVGGDNCQVFVSSYTVKCFDQLLAWAQGESYKDYPLKPKVKIEAPSNDENNSLSFVPCRSTIVEVNQMKVLVISSHQVDTKSDEVKTFICLSQDSISSATHDNIEAAQLPGLVTFIPRVSFKIIQPMYGEHLSALLSIFLAPPKHLMRSCYTQYDLELPTIKCCVSSCSPLHGHNYRFPTETENLIHVQNLSIKLDRLQGVDSWKERLSMVSEQMKCCLDSVSVKLTLIGMELMLHVIDSWLLLFKKECKAESVIDTSSLFSPDVTNDETLIFNMNFSDIIVDFAKTFSSLLLGGALKSLNAFWTLNDVNYPLIQCSHQVCHHSTLDDFRLENLNRPRKNSKVFPTLSGNSWTEDSHCMALLLQVPHDLTKKGCLFVNVHHIDVCVDISILSVLLSCYHVYPSYIMPSVFQYLQASVSESSLSDNQEALQRLQERFSHNIMQVEMKGIQVFLLKTESTTSPQYVSSEDYSKSIATHLLQSGETFKLWSISLPMMVALTAGHKKVRISSELIKTGINLNMFNEFETLNVGFETCEAFSVSSDSKSEQLHYEQMIEPFCATCTIACSNLDKGDCKTCVSLHLDVEPIELNISGAHLNLQANFMTSALTLVKDIYHKLKGLPIDFDGVSNVDPASYSLASNSFGPNDSKSKIEVTDKKPKKKSWPLSVWLQCTVSRVVLNFIDDTSYFYKTSGSLEDISLSLDKQLVYLKLMCSFNSCKLHQSPKSSNGPSTCLDGLSLSPMYTAVPSFIKADGFQTEGGMTPGKPPVSGLKPGKFVEIVYARALVEDYHKRKLQKEEEAKEGDQELKPEDEIPMKEYLHEITFNMQAFDVVANPTAVQDLAINLFGEALKLIKKESTQATNRPRLTEIPRLYVNIGGCRVFVPVASACSSKMESLENDVLVLSLNKLEINPKPENLLSRLVVSPSVYANAQSRNLLECPGSYVEDIQIECTMQDISVGGANWSAILDSIDKSKPCDNPALHWNTTGETEAGPHFYPIVDQFDLLMVYAPAISYLKSEHEKVVVCAPSLEVNFLKDCYFHLNLMHCSLLAQTYIACQNVITPKGNVSVVDRSDSPFVFESTCGGSSLGSSRPVKASKARLMGEFFITGKNFMLSFYQTLNRKSNRFKPLLFLNVVQPTFCSHVSKKREKVELQVHDLSFNVLKYQTASDEEGSASSKSEMIKVFQTKTGMVKTRTGVPASFLFANVTNFLTRKACLNIVVEKPLHFCLNPSLVDHTCLWLKEVCPVLEYMKKARMSPTTSIPAEDHTNLNFSKLKLTSSQLILDVDCPSSSVRSSIQGLSIETCLCESQWSTDLNASGLSVRTTDTNAITSELLFPFSIEANFTVNGISLVSDKIRKLTLKLSPVRLKLSPTVVDTILNCIKTTKGWMLQVIDGLPDRTVTSLAKLGSSVYFESPDDLRRGSYEYISVTDPSVLPQAGQICFYDGENHGVMAWCNKQPVKVKRFEIVPLMLQDNALDASASIECSLEIYNEASQKFETVHDFRVEESKAIRFELEQSDDFVSDRWRVVVHSRVLSPKMLAASMKVDCVFDSKDLPSLLVCFDIDQLTVVSSEDTACVDCAKLEVSNVQGSLRLCMESQAFTFVLKPVMSVSMFLINYSHLTWIPTILPFTVSSSVSSSVNNINATCSLSDVVEVHVSQKILKSIQSLINVWSPMLHKIGPAYNIKNLTGSPLLIGQAMTSECISLDANSNVWYTWRSNKIDPKLHVALKCHLGFSWCEPFAITQDNITLERYFDEKRVVVIDVETNDSLETTITVSGCVSFVNDLPFELHMHGKSDQEEFVVRLAADKEERADFLFPPDSLQSLSISNLESGGGCKLDMSNLFGSNKRSMAKVTCDENADGKYIQAVSYKQNMRMIVRFLPIFMLRSHLPSQCTIHIDTRSEKKHQQICIDGKGCETALFNLNPDLTHHFSIQIEANDAPFDAAIPMHSSLIYSMEGNQNFTQTKLRFNEYFPYHSISEYLSRSNEKWDQQEGSIKAKLSLKSGSLLMEITPWCLINNRTDMTLCFSSKSGDTTVVQPSQVTVPHHFTSVFAFQTSNSAKSKWYQIDQDVEHPSRVEKKSESLKIWNGSVQHVTLKKQDGVIDVLMKCYIRFGMLVFDISTPWKIRNLSSVHDLKLSASVGPSLGSDKTSQGSAIEALNDDFVSINEWKVTQGRIVSSGDVSKEQGGDVKMSSNDSTSSFLCLDQINAETYKIFSLNDRLLTMSASDLSVTFSVREDFVRKVVNLKAGDDADSFLQMYLTKESYDGEVFLVISDVTKPNLLFCNHTSFHISLQEQVDFENTIDLQIPPDGGEVPYECVAVSENFPYCKRKAFHANFKLRVDEQTEWSGFSLTMREGKHEVVLGDGLVLWVVLRDINPIKVHLYEKESDCKRVKSPIIAQSRSFKLMLNEFKLVCLDDVSTALYSLDILQCCFTNVKLELKDSAAETWTLHFMVDDIQSDTHICQRYPVFVTSNVDETFGAGKDSFYFAVMFDNQFKLQAVDVGLKSVEIMCEDGFLKVLAHLFESYSKAIKPKFVGGNVDDFATSLIRNSQAVCSPVQMSFISIKPFNVVVTLNTSYKLDVTLHKGSINFSKLICLNVCGRWSDITEEVARHYFADAVFGAGWVIGSADIIGNPMTTLRNFSKGFSDLLFMPYASIGSGPSAFLSGLTGGVSSLMRNVSYGLLQSVTNVASGLSRNMNSVSGEHEKISFCAEIPGTEVKVYLPHTDPKSAQNAKAPGYMSTIGKTVVKVVTKPLGGAASLVSRMGETIIVSSGMNHVYKPLYKCTSHRLSNYCSSLKKYSQKVHSFFGDDAEHPPCLVSMSCRSNGCPDDESLRVWVLSSDSMFIIRPNDDTIECVLSIEDLCVGLSGEDGSNITVQCNSNQKQQPCEEATSCNDKVAAYLGFDEIDDEYMDDVEVVAENSSSTYCAVAVHPYEARLFASIFHVLKKCKDSYSW